MFFIGKKRQSNWKLMAGMNIILEARLIQLNCKQFWMKLNSINWSGLDLISYIESADPVVTCSRDGNGNQIQAPGRAGS